MSRVATSGYPQQQQHWAAGAGAGAGAGGDAVTWALCDGMGDKFAVRDSFLIGSGRRCDLLLPVSAASVSVCVCMQSTYSILPFLTPTSTPPPIPNIKTHFDEIVAKIERRSDGQYGICDLQSRDGTYVNNQRLRPQVEVLLQQGDRVRFGRNYVRV